MSSERGLWNVMQPRVSSFGVFKRIENSCDLGTPDVCWQMTLRNTSFTGWLELKEEVWPKRPLTPLHIESLTRDQVLWHFTWEKAGGRIGTLAQVGNDYLFFTPEVLRSVFRRELCRAQLMQYNLGSRIFPTVDLLKRLIA